MTEKKKFNYGGQAVIEGVMIRGRTSVVTAVRRPNGEITVDTRPVPAISSSWMRRMPFIRGIVILIEAMVLGIKSLMFSANVAIEEEHEEMSTKAMVIMLGSAAVLVVLLFFLAPFFLTKWIDAYFPSGSLAFTVIEGAIRLIIFIGYLKVIGMMPDIKRVFTYHGAEHKSVNAYEAGVPMEVEAIKNYSRAHVRCGTSFLFLVLIIAIIVFTFVGKPNMAWWISSRIVLIPVIMGLGYEVIYFGAKYTRNWLVKIILAPGLLMQSLTTGEPDDKQLEVAIAAMNKAVEIDNVAEAAAQPAGQ